MSNDDYWDYRRAALNADSLLTHEEVKWWLNSLSKAEAESVVKTSQRLYQLGLVVRAVRNSSDNRIFLTVNVEHEDSLIRIASFQDGVQKKEFGGGFSKHLDESKSLLPLRTFNSKAYAKANKFIRSNELDLNRFREIAPLILWFSEKDALVLWNDEVNLVDAWRLRKLNVPVELMKEYKDFPDDWVAKLTQGT